MSSLATESENGPSSRLAQKKSFLHDKTACRAKSASGLKRLLQACQAQVVEAAPQGAEAAVAVPRNQELVEAEVEPELQESTNIVVTTRFSERLT